MKYDINFKKITTEQLPFSMRRALAALLVVLTFPLRELHIDFKYFQWKTLRALDCNAQYPNLQRLLNNNFDYEARRIRVYESPGTINPAIAYNSGQHGKPQLSTCFVVYSWHDWGYRPFIVDISFMPSGFKNNTNNINQITRTVNIYKFSGTKFQIKLD